MISRISSNNWIVLKSALKRLKWFSILYAVALFLQLPLLLWMNMGRQKAVEGALWVANKSFQPQMLFHPVASMTNAIVAVIFGLIIFHYLHQNRANTFFHSLPIKRGMLYFQNLFAGLVLIWLPILLNGLLIGGVFAVFGVTEGQWYGPNMYGPGMELVNGGPTAVPVWQLLAYWFLINLLMTGLFLIFTVFVGMLTGNVLLQGALTFIGLFLPLGFYLMGKYNLWKLLYGFSRDVNDSNVEWLSPLVSYVSDNTYRSSLIEMGWYIGYFIVALLLVAGSIYLYKKRHAEAAGETLAANWIRWIFKYGVAVCAAMTGGLYFSSMNENSAWALYLGYLIGAVLGYSISDMIAYKSFHFYKRWKGMLVFGAVLIIVVGSIKLDVFGYEKYVPAQEEVKQVYLGNLNGDGFFMRVDGDSNVKGLTTKENIERSRQLHQKIISMEAENKAQEMANYRRQVESAAEPEEPLIRIMPLEIAYTLQNGAKVTRSYNIDIFRYSEYLSPIFQTQEARKSMFSRFFQIDPNKIDQLNVFNHHLGKNIRIYKRGEIDEALAALRKDLLNISYEAAIEGKVPTRANIEFVTKVDSEKNYGQYNLSYYVEFKFFEAFLKEHGYLGELFLNPGDVSKIIVQKIGSKEIVEVKDKEKIETLLNWCNIEDQQIFTMKQQQSIEKGRIEYYGKIEKENGSTIFVGFEGSPYALRQINKLLK